MTVAVVGWVLHFSEREAVRRPGPCGASDFECQTVRHTQRFHEDDVVLGTQDQGARGCVTLSNLRYMAKETCHSAARNHTACQMNMDTTGLLCRTSIFSVAVRLHDHPHYFYP